MAMYGLNPPPAIHSLPNELILAIATVVLEDCAPNAPFKTEWILSHVSSRFRQAIVGAPTFWTLVKVDLSSEGSVEITKLYLERSQPYRISVTVQHRSTAETMDQALIEERFSLVVSHIHRTSRLNIILGAKSDNSMLAPFRNAKAPYLEHLKIYNEATHFRDTPSNIFSLVAPRLTFLKATAIVLDSPVPRWASLTHLELSRCAGLASQSKDNGFLVGIAAQCSSLVDLFLDISLPSLLQRRIRQGFQDGRIRFPSLISLRLVIGHYCNRPFLINALSAFDVPALADLTIGNTHGDQILALLGSLNLFHSFPALASLSFVGVGCWCSRARVPAFSPQHIPTVRSLTLINQCFTKDIIRILWGSNSQPWPLETVTLCPQEDAVKGVCHALKDGVRSIRQRGQPIPQFKLSSALLARVDDWEENAVDAVMFDSANVIGSLNLF